MCGIVGYIGYKSAKEALIEGLKKLEYRGYDSSGIALFCNNELVVKKSAGKIVNLEKKLAEDPSLDGTVGIGHTRWATHGMPNDINAHPHTSEKVTLVHNGIIENYAKLKEQLISEGYVFTSDTDTEVMAHLINRYYKNLRDPILSIAKAVQKVKGSYALGIVFHDRPEQIYAVRCDSPLVVGLGKDENYIASDIPAFLNKTRNFCLIDEKEIAVLSREGVKIYDFDKMEIQKEVMTATWDVEAAEKGGYPHFMLKEICEQPKTLHATIAPRLVNGYKNILKAEIPDTSHIKRIKIVACGSAMHAGLFGKAAIEKLARVKVDVQIASEFRYCDPIFEDGDIVLIISQSGETADSLAALRLAKSKGIPVYAIVNVVGSSIAREADCTIYTWAGLEIAVATTKAFTAQVAILYMLALRLAYDKNQIDDETAKRLCDELEKIPELSKKVLSDEYIKNCQLMAAYNQSKHDLFFIGRGQDYAVCCEGSLKLKEISYMHSEAYPSGELKHGTISLIYDGVPCVAVSTDENVTEKTISNIKEVKARGADVLFVCTEGISHSPDFCDRVLEIPRFEQLFMPILAIIPLQLYAYYTALSKGCDVDKPRNLAKSVTVE